MYRVFRVPANQLSAVDLVYRDNLAGRQSITVREARTLGLSGEGNLVLIEGSEDGVGRAEAFFNLVAGLVRLSPGIVPVPGDGKSRFQPIFVGEPTVPDTIAILRGLKERYEVHHGVRITDNALVAAATLSDRYVGDRHLPDKAIDLIDEAASRLRIEIDSMPQEIDEIERRMIQLQIERQALGKETDRASKERLEALERELAELKERSQAMKAQWQGEKEAIARLREQEGGLGEARAAAGAAPAQRRARDAPHAMVAKHGEKGKQAM